MTTTQALSIAISNNGLTKLFDALVVSGPAFAANLNAWVPTTPPIPAMTIDGTNISNYKLTLETGSASGASGTLTSVTQLAEGSNQFLLTFDVGITITYQSWTESFTLSVKGHPGDHGPNPCGPATFKVTGVSLVATVEIQLLAGAWAFTYVTSSADASNADIPIIFPKDSIFGGGDYPGVGACGGKTIQQQLEPQLELIDFSSAVQAAIQPILTSITESGQLTSDIVFAWTPNTFSFPSSTIGLQSGVTGLVSYKGGAFSSTLTPPSMALPDIPASNDVRIFASDYLFTSLFWAYYQAGALTQTITANMLGADAHFLNTSDYKQMIPKLYSEYPNLPMQVVITQASAPTIAFVSGYELPAPYLLTPPALAAIAGQIPATDVQALIDQGVVDDPYSYLTDYTTAVATALGTGASATAQAIVIGAGTTVTASLAGALPPDVFTSLLGMTDTPYLDQASFLADLSSNLGSGPAAKYQTQILTAATTNFATYSHAPCCLYQVIKDGTQIDVFTIDIVETDVLANFQLAASGTSQTLQCEYQIPSGSVTGLGAPTATLACSEVGSVTTNNFTELWSFVLAAQYATIVQQVASMGVPVPFIEGYTFQNSTVTVQPGYLDVTADVVFSSGG